MRSLVLACLLLVVPTTALAGDGVLEINQTCAVQTGCFSGDTAGYPVTIDGAAGHSYRLTSDLVVPNENTDGIRIGDASVTNVSIDLAGFEIRGPVFCLGGLLGCTPASGTGSGIARAAGSNDALSVRNGSITGMGARGVILADQAEVRNLRVRWNRLGGIQVGSAAIVSDNLVYSNGGDGIVTQESSTISRNTVFNNFQGIVTGAGCSVQDNTLRRNGLAALSLGSQSAYAGNTIGGSVIGGVNMGGNSCNGTTVCP